MQYQNIVNEIKNEIRSNSNAVIMNIMTEDVILKMVEILKKHLLQQLVPIFMQLKEEIIKEVKAQLIPEIKAQVIDEIKNEVINMIKDQNINEKKVGSACDIKPEEKEQEKKQEKEPEIPDISTKYDCAN